MGSGSDKNSFSMFGRIIGYLLGITIFSIIFSFVINNFNITFKIWVKVFFLVGMIFIIVRFILKTDKVTSTFAHELKKGLKEFGEVITSIVNFVLLSSVYFISVGLTSIVAKVLGKHFFEIDVLTANDGSYWVDLDHKQKSINSYYRQF